MVNPVVEIENAKQTIRQHAPEYLRETFLSLLRYGVNLKVARVDDADLPVGCSKFGGAPDVPPGFEFPSWGEETGFLAQINLQEISVFDIDSLLPAQGVLSFFLDVSFPTGRVYWFEDSSLLQRTPNQIPALCRTCSITPIFAVELLDFIEAPVPEFADWGDHWDEFHRLLKIAPAFYPSVSSDSTNKMLGYGYGVGSYIHPSLYDQDGNKVSPPPTLLNWQLLLQVNSDDNLDVCWWDAGFVHFTIDEEDLAARRFEKAVISIDHG